MSEAMTTDEGETSEIATTPNRGGRAGLFGIAFALILLSAAVLAVSGVTRSLSSGLSWTSIVLSLAAVVVAFISLRARRG